MQRLYLELWRFLLSELVPVLIMLPVFRLIRESSRVRLSEITTGWLVQITQAHPTSVFDLYLSSCHGDAYVANAAVVEKNGFNLLLHVQLGSRRYE